MSQRIHMEAIERRDWRATNSADRARTVKQIKPMRRICPEVPEMVYYNLDMIISIGCRVKSHVATRFRQWVPKQLRQQSRKQNRPTEEGHRTKDPEGEAMILSFKLLREFGI